MPVAGHQDRAARGFATLFQRGFGKTVDIFGLSQVYNRRFDVVGDDTIVAEQFDGGFDDQFVPETDDPLVFPAHT